VGECGDAREFGHSAGGPCGLCQGVLGVDEDEPESELVLEDVVLEDVVLEDVVLEDVVLEDVVLEDVVLEDVEESELVVDAEPDAAVVVEELEEPRASFL